MPTRISWTAGFAVMLAALALLAAGCGDGEIRGLSPGDTDYLMTAGVTDGEVGASATDVRCTQTFGLPLISFTVDVDFLAQGGAGGPVGPTTPLTNFRLLRYVVTYENETVPGGPVPAPLVIQIPFVEEVPATFELTGWFLMSNAQKNQFPLNDPDGTFVDGQLRLAATVTVFGAPASDISAEISSSFTVLLTVIDSCAGTPLGEACPPALLDPLGDPFDPTNQCF